MENLPFTDVLQFYFFTPPPLVVKPIFLAAFDDRRSDLFYEFPMMGSRFPTGNW